MLTTRPEPEARPRFILQKRYDVLHQVPILVPQLRQQRGRPAHSPECQEHRHPPLRPVEAAQLRRVEGRRGAEEQAAVVSGDAQVDGQLVRGLLLLAPAGLDARGLWIQAQQQAEGVRKRGRCNFIAMF